MAQSAKIILNQKPSFNLQDLNILISRCGWSLYVNYWPVSWELRGFWHCPAVYSKFNLIRARPEDKAKRKALKNTRKFFFLGKFKEKEQTSNSLGFSKLWPTEQSGTFDHRVTLLNIIEYLNVQIHKWIIRDNLLTP